MMIDLQEMQFEVLESEDSSFGFGFGIGLEVSVDDGGFDPGANDWIVQDSVNPTRGTVQFGEDVLSGPTWGFDLHVDREDVPGALASLGRFATAWRALKVASIPGAVVPLRYGIGGRTRRVYGRPRKYAAPPSNRILGGYVPITADFKCVDSFTYDDLEQTIQIPVAVPVGAESGFNFPTVFPTATVPNADRSQALNVGGDAPAYPVIRIDGPISRPYVATDEWRLDLDIVIDAGEYVVIDTRPWHLTVLKNGTQSVAGELGRRQWLSDVKFWPGQHSVRFGGTTSTGGAACTVSWRNTHNSL